MLVPSWRQQPACICGQCFPGGLRSGYSTSPCLQDLEAALKSLLWPSRINYSSLDVPLSPSCQLSWYATWFCRLLPQLIQHGSQQPALANLVLAELPPANQCTLNILLETFHRLSGNAAVNEMDAHTLATVMTPCLAWHPPPKPKVTNPKL